MASNSRSVGRALLSGIDPAGQPIELFQSLPLSERNAWAVLATRSQNRAGIWLWTWYCCECGAGVHSNHDIEDLEAEIEKHECFHGIT